MNTCMFHIIVNVVNIANVASVMRAVMTYAVRLSAIAGAIVPRRAARRAHQSRD